MSIVRNLMVLTCIISALYFLFRTYSSIRRIQSIGFLHHFRLYMPISGVLVSLGAAWASASPQLWYLSGTILLIGSLVALRETVWVVRAGIGTISANRALSAERRFFREHDEEDRKVLSGLRQSLECAGWAWKARRFRDTHRSTQSVLERLHQLQARRAVRPGREPLSASRQESL